MTLHRIESGALTVPGLASHFRRLKASASEMQARGEATRRGYFVPTEEAELRHLLVSYWQSRNALMDLILSLRESPELELAEFLMGFAGALVLVDGARFLREEFGDNRVVQAKLNEPDVRFGIPEGTYDTVQRSLTSPANVWRLYQAALYFEHHEAEIKRAAARRSDLKAVLDVVYALDHRLELGWDQYISERLRVRTRQFIGRVKQTALRKMMFRLQRILSETASSISLNPSHRPGLPAAVSEQLRDVIRPGDIMITRKEYALTNYFLPGYWPHAALYLGEVEELNSSSVFDAEPMQSRRDRLETIDTSLQGRVLEALKDGVWLRSVASPLASDSLVVIRPALEPTVVFDALGRSVGHEGKPYDFDFDFTRSQRLVCTEVVYRTYDGVGGIRFQLSRRAGRMTLSASDLLRMALDGRQFELVTAYIPDRSEGLLGQGAGEAVSQMLGDDGPDA